MSKQLTVAVCYLDEEGRKQKEGDVILDGGEVTLSNPDSMMLQNILSRPVWLADGSEVYAKDDTELFMRSLPIMYDGSYA